MSSFQPTHPHGVRRTCTGGFAKMSSFQPTHPHGVRRVGVETVHAGAGVPTHAPARGATSDPSSQNCSSTSSNPRTRTGCDEVKKMNGKLALMFQPTHPHGVRPGLRRPGNLHQGRSNPRTRTGCDKLLPLGREIETQFQPTHPHGVRHRYNNIRIVLSEFQPTHPHGVRRFRARNRRRRL